MHNRMINYNLIGEKFGKLTVIKATRQIKNNKSYKMWLCLCDCGNEWIVSSSNLKRNGVKSCGCLRNTIRITLKPGQKFNKLTTISYIKGSNWLCKCDCGNEKIIKSDKLKTGKTKSCGCLHKEIARNKLKEFQKTVAKEIPKISSARAIWRSYCYADGFTIKNSILSFEDFYQLSQNNCEYCGIFPSNKTNIFTYYNPNGIKPEGDFIYNGLDRIDNNKKHTKENCASCCIICNRAKNNRTKDLFLEYVKLLKPNKKKYNYNIMPLPNDKSLVSIIKNAWKSNYAKENISIEFFYSLSQIPCFYCNTLNSNKLKNAKSIFHYNGLDRINNLKGHFTDNVVPCCKWCNFTKSKLTLSDFYDWIERIQIFQKSKLFI